ncbi:large conductance mechanosensitive channel protein MscL [Mycolicibacter kumamotonensis]|uniref:Mechanosensitive ion channel protein MscL n=1 Tax=Mycolicibacter kumamotonensis TaxID=354243 RepID=A0A1B8SLS2_9MYCO|nr:MscL family protein [Mycolicibacter kumamotonensis]NDJ89558.1 MscL family protein [Mycolicibacter kumamotonensis]OBY33689.1 mechanosensitive ion channel protein MscL [Mycolicibacter kumamotonensis]ORA77953.1 mechanosensitive ion channel protein MscL [Mycolicibacter kumamotonensis]
MFKGFKNFLMRDDVITVAIGLVVALAFSNLVKAFTDSVINPLVAAAQPDTAGLGLGYQLGAEGNEATFVDLGAFISAIIYFIVFMATIYFFIVLPYKHIQKRRGKAVFGDAPPTKTCPECASEIAAEATKCKFCASPQPAAAA